VVELRIEELRRTILPSSSPVKMPATIRLLACSLIAAWALCRSPGQDPTAPAPWGIGQERGWPPREPPRDAPMGAESNGISLGIWSEKKSYSSGELENVWVILQVKAPMTPAFERLFYRNSRVEVSQGFAKLRPSSSNRRKTGSACRTEGGRAESPPT
jgi:hypothetical protein